MRSGELGVCHEIFIFHFSQALRVLRNFLSSNLFLSLHMEAEESRERRSSVTSEVNLTDGVVIHRHEVFKELQNKFSDALCM